MWNLSKEIKEKFLKCTSLPIHESDEDWENALREAKEEGEDLIARLEEDLEESKTELLAILPDRFIPYVKSGIIKSTDITKNSAGRLLTMGARSIQEIRTNFRCCL